MESSRTIKGMGEAPTRGKTEKPTLVNGETTRVTVTELRNSQTEADMRANIRITGDTEKAFFLEKLKAS